MTKETLKEVKMKQAVQYCFDHQLVSMHEVAVAHGLENAAKLQHEYRKEWYARNKGVERGNAVLAIH